MMPEVRSDEGGLSDWDLLSRAQDGDENAFHRIVERHQDRLIGLCQRMLNNREEALDAAQEVFLKTYRKAGGLEQRGELYTWMYRVATNNCLNRLRRRKIVRFLPLISDSGEDSVQIQPVDGAPRPDEVLESHQRWESTRGMIADLPDNQRAVLILAKFEGMSYREIAETLAISEGAVESRLFRAMRNLEKAQEVYDSRVSKTGPGQSTEPWKQNWCA
jgi:RNA polymerase sigma-70 factor (ECF subfamily)